MANIDGLTFGSIVIEGRKYHRDALILAGGAVTKRKGGFTMFVSHEIKERVLQELSDEQPEVIFIDTGTDGALILPPRLNTGRGQVMQAYWLSHPMMPSSSRTNLSNDTRRSLP